MKAVDTEASGTAPCRSGQRSSSSAVFEVDVGDAVEPFLDRCARLQGPGSLPFHGNAWLRAWYSTLGKADGRWPLLVGVRQHGVDVMLLPLCTSRLHGLSVVSFADARAVDYNAPLMAPGFCLDPASGSALLRALRQALRGHDVLLLEKMLAAALSEDGAAPNPLMQVIETQRCEQVGNEFQLGEDWDAWRHTLDKRVRKEFERAWRVFTRSPQARFERVLEADAARQLFAELERQQSQRMHTLACDYVLDRPAYRAFYRQVLDGGLADGSAVLTTLRDGDQVVAAQLGIANGARYIALRLSIGGDQWKACSPGRLLDERTARHLHGQGLRVFDLGIGAYFHKESFNVAPIPLHDACVALSARGALYARYWRLRRAAKRWPWLVKAWRTLRPVRAAA